MPEKEEKEIKEKKEEKKDWWALLPTNLKILGLVITLFFFYQANQTGKPIQWTYIGLTWLILYLMGREKPTEEIMNETLARKLVKQKLKEFVSNNDLPKGTQYWVSENVDLQYSEARPKYYLFGLLLRMPNGRRLFKQAKVDYLSWDVTVQSSLWDIRGTEAVPTKRIVPDIVKWGKKYPDLMKSDIFRFLTK